MADLMSWQPRMYFNRRMLLNDTEDGGEMITLTDAVRIAMEQVLYNMVIAGEHARRLRKDNAEMG